MPSEGKGKRRRLVRCDQGGCTRPNHVVLHGQLWHGAEQASASDLDLLRKRHPDVTSWLYGYPLQCVDTIPVVRIWLVDGTFLLGHENYEGLMRKDATNLLVVARELVIAYQSSAADMRRGSGFAKCATILPLRTNTRSSSWDQLKVSVV